MLIALAAMSYIFLQLFECTRQGNYGDGKFCLLQQYNALKNTGEFCLSILALYTLVMPIACSHKTDILSHI